jgi:tRNA(fMet)-specific endonuclease VapC
VASLFLLDTSVCVDILRGSVAATGLPPAGRCCLSSIVTAELRTGVAKTPANTARARKLEDFIRLFPVRDFDDAAARHYGEIRAELEKKGTTIGPLDLLIAAHARSLGASLVTGNIREFRRVKDLKLTEWKSARG